MNHKAAIMTTSPKRHQSETRAKAITDVDDLRNDVAQMREMLATLMRERRLFVVAPEPARPKPVSPLEEELKASIAQAEARNAGRYSQAATEIPEDSGSLVGKRFYVRVTGVKVLCEVVKEAPGMRRGFYLRRVDNGRLLTRARARTALHDSPKPMSFPPKKST